MMPDAVVQGPDGRSVLHTKEGLMRKIIVGLLAITIATISVHGAVARKAKDYPNSVV